MLENPQFLSPEDISHLRSWTPVHLKPYLFFVNPYLLGDELWPQLPCFGAAFSFYTNSLEGYLEVERTILRSVPKIKDHKILPTIIDQAFIETESPSLGDVEVFYRGDRHVHGGIYIGIYKGANTTLSKANRGNLPLLIDKEEDLSLIYRANVIRYFTPQDPSRKLEDIFLS